jgi:glyoxylase-like metal-dependent hydrolase (beta-lactamase superfamily II)
MNFRVVGIAALLTAICACTGASANAPHVLLPGHIDLAIGPDGNTVILDAPEGLVVIDSGRHARHAAAILDHARRTGKPIAAVVNTHWHLDHTTGNRDLLAAYPDARLIATGAIEGALDGFLAPGRERARRQAADEALPDEERARARRALAAVEDRAAIVPADPVTGDTVAELGGRTY